MNISKADAIAHLAKWYDAKTEIRAVYKSITGRLSVAGRMKELSASGITITGIGCEIRLFFGDTSEYDYRDARQPDTDANKDRLNKYPAFIGVKFSNRDEVEISEFFPEQN
jgi:hypothetical protein